MSVIKIEVTSWDGGETVDNVEYRVSYLVTTNNRDDGPQIVKQALPISLDMPYSSGNDFDAQAILNGVTVTQASEGDFYHWVVDATYKSTEQRTNPLIEPIQETISWNGVQRETWVYADGSVIQNTAGMGFDNPMTFIDNLPVLSYTVNQASFPFSLATLVRNSVNITTWKGMAPKTVKIQAMTTERIVDGRFGVYYRVNYVFEHNPETYMLRTPSIGRYELKYVLGRAFVAARPGIKEVLARPAGWVLSHIMKGGKEIDAPVLLNAAGGEWEIADGPPPVVSGDLYTPMEYNVLFSFLS